MQVRYINFLYAHLKASEYAYWLCMTWLRQSATRVKWKGDRAEIH